MFGERMKPENVKCPDCEGPMVSRTGKFGVFWGCKAFPNCKGTRDSMGRSKADREAWKREKALEEGEKYEEGMSFNGDTFFKWNKK